MVAAVSNTVYGIINDAMHDAGYLQEGAQANSEQLATYQRRLCDIINLWQTQGLKLFFIQEIVVPLVAGQTMYALRSAGGAVNMVKPMRILQAFVQDVSGNNKRPLTPLAQNEWFLLNRNTGTYGAVNSYYVDKQSTSLNVNLWQTPNAAEAANLLHIVTQVAAPNPANLEENVSFPQEWRIALRWGLADDIATGQPQAIMDRCSDRAIAYREMLENWDVEDTSVRFSMDSRNYGGSSFI